MSRRSKDRSAFTLIELVAVIVVLAILGAVAIPKYWNVSNRAYRALAISFNEQLRTTRTTYTAAVGRLPRGYFTWVTFSGIPTDSTFEWHNLVLVDGGIRRHLLNENENVWVSSGDPNVERLRFEFKNGLIAQYDYDLTTGSITMTLTGP